MRKILAILVAAASLLLIACSNKAETVGKLKCDGNEENYIYIFENEMYVPYIVLSHDYNGNTLLLRKDVLSKERPINDYFSYYEDSNIDRFLNTDYLCTISAMQNKIIESDIVITDKKSMGVSGRDVKTIKRKVFLLSSDELNLSFAMAGGTEGKAIKYFNDENNRIAYCEGKAVSWWLRTPVSYYNSVTSVVGIEGKFCETNSSDNNGVRPAFCISNNQKIVLSDEIVEGRKVYILA